MERVLACVRTLRTRACMERGRRPARAPVSVLLMKISTTALLGTMNGSVPLPSRTLPVGSTADDTLALYSSGTRRSSGEGILPNFPFM